MTDETKDESLVRRVVNRTVKRLPTHIDTDDLYSVGYIGLRRAHELFDTTRGTRFESFAWQHINGAILDYLRALDWVPRSVRQKSSRLAAAQAGAAQRKGSRASDEEVADALGLELPEYFRLVADAETCSYDSLDRPINDSSTLAEVLGTKEQTPEERLSDLESVELALGALSERERLVVERIWLNGENMLAVGKSIGITESRISQINTKAMKKMQKRLAA